MRMPVAFAALLIAAPALAADYPGQPGPAPVLRGALPGVHAASTDWSGFYFGGSAGYANANSKYEDEPLRARLNALGRSISPSTPVSSALQANASPGSGRLLFREQNQSGVMTFGGFLGYNYQSDDTVFGIEMDYSRGRMKGERTGDTAGVVGPYFFNGNARTDTWSASTKSSFQIQDFGTIRGRAGHAMGNVMPYLTGGLAWARASNADTTSISGTYRETDLATPPAQVGAGTIAFNPNSSSAGTKTRFHFGYALGAGVDVALSQNIFFRAEAIHTRIADVGGTNVQINQIRAGAAVKY